MIYASTTACNVPPTRRLRPHSAGFPDQLPEDLLKRTSSANMFRAGPFEIDPTGVKSIQHLDPGSSPIRSGSESFEYGSPFFARSPVGCHRTVQEARECFGCIELGIATR